MATEPVDSELLKAQSKEELVSKFLPDLSAEELAEYKDSGQYSRQDWTKDAEVKAAFSVKDDGDRLKITIEMHGNVAEISASPNGKPDATGPQQVQLDSITLFSRDGAWKHDALCDKPVTYLTEQGRKKNTGFFNFLASRSREKKDYISGHAARIAETVQEYRQTGKHFLNSDGWQAIFQPEQPDRTMATPAGNNGLNASSLKALMKNSRQGS